jgi:hypothetical protein
MRIWNKCEIDKLNNNHHLKIVPTFGSNPTTKKQIFLTMTTAVAAP